MKLATFNVNSIRKRAGHVRRFLARQQPDLLFLQELKCRTEEFPSLEFEGTGYRVHAIGQQGGRNGVAVLGRIPFEVVADTLPGDEADTQAFKEIRDTIDGKPHQAVSVDGGEGEPVRMAIERVIVRANQNTTNPDSGSI